jgi:hypothetical protein
MMILQVQFVRKVGATNFLTREVARHAGVFPAGAECSHGYVASAARWLVTTSYGAPELGPLTQSGVQYVLAAATGSGCSAGWSGPGEIFCRLVISRDDDLPVDLGCGFPAIDGRPILTSARPCRNLINFRLPLTPASPPVSMSPPGLRFTL